MFLVVTEIENISHLKGFEFLKNVRFSQFFERYPMKCINVTILFK